MNLMRRRDILALLVLAGSASRALAQAGGGLPHVVFLGFATPEADAPQMDEFRAGLREQGLIDGQTIRFQSRHLRGDMSLVEPTLQDLVRLPAAVVLAPGPAAARIVRQRTRLPCVAIGLPPAPGDHDLFTSIARPGGTITGFSYFGEDLSAKRIEVLREVLPKARVVGVLHNIVDPVFRQWGEQTEASVRAAGLTPVRLGLSSPTRDELKAHFAILRAQGGDSVIVIRDFLTHTALPLIIAEADAAGVAVVAEQRAFPDAGALLSYGADISALFRRSGTYVARILKGESPGDLPIQFPTKFELVVNLRTARALGIVVPNGILAAADDVID